MVCLDDFKAKISMDAWTIPETVYEGTQVVKASKLQMLITRFDLRRLRCLRMNLLMSILLNLRYSKLISKPRRDHRKI